MEHDFQYATQKSSNLSLKTFEHTCHVELKSVLTFGRELGKIVHPSLSSLQGVGWQNMAFIFLNRFLDLTDVSFIWDSWEWWGGKRTPCLFFLMLFALLGNWRGLPWCSRPLRLPEYRYPFWSATACQATYLSECVLVCMRNFNPFLFWAGETVFLRGLGKGYSLPDSQSSWLVHFHHPSQVLLLLPLFIHSECHMFICARKTSVRRSVTGFSLSPWISGWNRYCHKMNVILTKLLW